MCSSLYGVVSGASKRNAESGTSSSSSSLSGLSLSRALVLEELVRCGAEEDEAAAVRRSGDNAPVLFSACVSADGEERRGCGAVTAPLKNEWSVLCC